MIAQFPKASNVLLIYPTTGEILACTRRGTTDDWGLIGGKVDQGETPVQAAAREFKEEAGIDLQFWPNLILEKVDDHGYSTSVFIVTRHEDIESAIAKFGDGPKEVEPGILVGFVQYHTLIEGTFGKFNQEILPDILGYMASKLMDAHYR